MSHKKTFPRANITAFIATVVDFGILSLLVEVGGAYYVAANAFSAFSGAITNFTLNKFWTFGDSEGPWHKQGLRYFLVALSSLALNTLFLFLFTEFAGLMYLKSKVLASLTVGWGWNYPMHRYFVFPKTKDYTRE